MEVGHPHPTLYLQNLNERVRPEHMKQTLVELCSPHGQIVKITAKKRLALRGQAWIQFDSTDSARRALSHLQGRRLYGKSVVARFARWKSDEVSRAEGSLETDKQHREMEKIEKARVPRMTRRQIMAQLMANPTMAAMGMAPAPLMAPGMGVPPNTAALGLPMGVGSDMQLPNKILFITAIPPGTSEDTLNTIFGRFPGFQEVRGVPGRPDLSFAEYENEAMAAAARGMLDNHEIVPGGRIRVSFARR